MSEIKVKMHLNMHINSKSSNNIVKKHLKTHTGNMRTHALTHIYAR